MPLTPYQQYVENVDLARQRLAAKLADISLNPKPSYDIDGQRLEWNAYFDMLTSALDRIDKLKQRHGPVTVKWLGRAVNVVDIELEAL